MVMPVCGRKMDAHTTMHGVPTSRPSASARPLYHGIERMSIAAMSAVWGRRDVKGTTKMVLLSIANYANTAHVSWPSVSTIAADTGLSARQVQYAIKELGDMEVIQIQEQAGPKRTNLYRLPFMFPEGAHLAPCKQDDSDPSEGAHLAGVQDVQGAHLAPLDPKTDPNEPSEGAHLAPEPSLSIPSSLLPTSLSFGRDKKREPKTSTKKRERKNALPDGFEEWYELYPKKVARADAVKAWKQLDPDQTLRGDMIAALMDQIESTWAERETRFIPNPATWIRQERWLDDTIAAKPPAKEVRVSRGPRDTSWYDDFVNGTDEDNNDADGTIEVGYRER